MSSFSLLSVCLLFLGCLGLVTSDGHWSYEGETGPDHWCEISNGCCGTKQSPIDLGLNARVSSKRQFVFKNYDVVPEAISLENNGHSIAVTLDSNGPQRTVSGGGLPGTYVFHSFHFHWGKNSRQGSEHTLYGYTYPMELHMVHYNSKFPDLGSAVESGESDALAVLGVMYYLSLDANDALENIVTQLNEVTYFGQKTQLENSFALTDLLPVEKRFFFRYDGSLTTPGCNEAVVWTVFFMPVPVSESQMCAFRTLLTSTEGESEHLMMGNFRPVLPLGRRRLQFISAI